MRTSLVRPIARLAALAALGAAALVAGCTERDSLATGISGGGGGTGTGGPRGSVRIRVEDDPSGAVGVVNSGGARPTVTLVFDAQLVGASNVTVADSNQVAIQVPLGQSAETFLITNDSVPQGSFSAVRLTITRAQLAIPGQPEVTDLLSGAANATLQRTLTVNVATGAISSLIIDLNSANWLTPIANPAPGAPPFSFTGSVDFRNAIQVRTP